MMGWSGKYFEHQLHKFDPKLRVRLSHAGDCWLIERRATRGSACALTPRYERGPDAWKRDKDGYVYVMAIRRDLLNHQAFLDMRDCDIQARGGAQKYADMMDEEDRQKELKLEADQSKYLQDRSEEVYDKHMIKQGSVVSNFHPKVEVNDKRRFTNV
jgi:hypothetical protein